MLRILLWGQGVSDPRLSGGLVPLREGSEGSQVRPLWQTALPHPLERQEAERLPFFFFSGG